MTKIRRWRLTEPVRLYLYGVALATLALASGVGWLTSTTTPLFAGLVVAVLAVPTTEVTRASVYAPATVATIRRVR
jgi:hypothetical protein